MGTLVDFAEGRKRLYAQTINISGTLQPHEEYLIVCSWLKKCTKVLRLHNINTGTTRAVKVEDYHRENTDRPMRIEFHSKNKESKQKKEEDEPKET